MRTIVVGVDGSPESLDALRFAQTITGAGDTIHLVMAWKRRGPSGTDEPKRGSLEDATRERMAAILETVPAGEADREARIVRARSASKALIEAADGADLLVIGTQAHPTMERLFSGSVAVQCAHHVRGAMLAVPEGAITTEGPVAVAYDRSDSARAALDQAASIAAGLGESLRVIMVRELDDSDDDTIEDAVRAEVAELVTGVDDVDVLVVDESTVHESSTAVVAALLEAAEGARLLVMGSRGRGGFTGLLLGSVSQRSLEMATLPLCIVRED